MILSWFGTHKMLTVLVVVLALVVVVPTFLKYLDNEIRAAINTEASDISQCKAVPVGEKACGGPGGYVVYSTKGTDIHRYLSLVNFRQKLLSIIFSPITLITEPGFSDCSLETPPKIELSNGNCHIKN